MTDTPTEQPPVTNTRSVVGLAACAVIALVGIFLIPTLQEPSGGLNVRFWTMVALELLAMVGVVYFVLNLHEEPE
ncbi:MULTISPECIES: hypothetical protein [Halorubrum]|jgi:hypothetical protein|uniref:Bacterio-opsin-associated protein n=1 Tax=Halorubrum tropicale TaxID=1765655 RepID=A0A0N0BR84_9EURY|nr:MULTISPECIES: hypothetical protein [Halorubrum]KOX96494.1 hypothetical protein AMR74_08625 [Halorubrum tropicale]RLM52451.1 hypothetical protein DVK06_02855 [Halorubrum sp. Atlit-28R]TKX44258.1 hypothetical protein EXE50_07845 [Halorubrum sp. ARQ200]TKX50835.1 hypothetical protein EXE49_04175 [Halorubrum sp. ASP121]TKX63593.1 hypothetical protein EXE48_00975 [Halorubrum sp. ASP1]